MYKDDLIDKIFRLTYNFNSKIIDVLIDGKKIKIEVTKDFQENLLDDLKTQLADFQIIVERE